MIAVILGWDIYKIFPNYDVKNPYILLIPAFNMCFSYHFFHHMNPTIFNSFAVERLYHKPGQQGA